MGKRLDMASEYLKAGMIVIPVCAASKIPFASGWNKIDIDHSKRRVGDWFECDNDLRLGIRTGKISGIFVIDTDDLSGFIHCNPFMTVKTPRGGYHLYFKYGEDAPLIGEKISDNRFVIAPPSPGYEIVYGGIVEKHNINLNIWRDAWKDRFMKTNPLGQMSEKEFKEMYEQKPVIETVKTKNPYFSTKKRPSEKQVGGDHYKGFKPQPYEYFIKNNLPFHKADIIKRILRYDLPTGKGLEDLKKIKHEVDLIIEFQEWENREA